MSNELTHPIKSQDGYPFNEFLWKCAKQFSPLVHLREDSGDQIRLPEKQDDLLQREARVKAAKKDLDKILAKTSEEKEEDASRAWELVNTHYRGLLARREVELRRYEKMLVQVTTWEPPTPDHENLKKFMIELINDGIGYDCKMPVAPERISAEDYYSEMKNYCMRALENAERALEQANNSGNADSEWILALFESVPPPTHMVPRGGLK